MHPRTMTPTSLRPEGTGEPVCRPGFREVSSTDLLALFIVGVSSSAAFIAIQSAPVFYMDIYGEGIYAYVIICLYGFALPSCIIQSTVDMRYEGLCSSIASLRARVMISFVGLAALLCVVPLVVTHMWSFFALISCVGLLSGEAYGIFYYIVSRLGDGESSAFFAMGYQGSALVALTVALLTQFWQHAWNPSYEEVTNFYSGMALVVLLGIAGYWFIDLKCELFARILKGGLHTSAPYGKNSIYSTDSAATVSMLQQPLICADWATLTPAGDVLLAGAAADKDDNGYSEGGKNRHGEAEKNLAVTVQMEMPTLPKTLQNTDEPLLPSGMISPFPDGVWTCAVALFLTVWGSVIIIPFFTYVQSASGNELLPEYLFYVRALCDMSARPITLAVKGIRTPSQLFKCAVARALLVPLYFIYILTGENGTRSDYVVCTVVGLFGFATGYLSTREYQLATKLCKTAQEKTQATHLLNISFQLAILMALMTGFIIRNAIYTPPPRSIWGAESVAN